MRVLITGGAGYIGTQVVGNLCQQPGVEKIIVYDNLSKSNFNFFFGPKYPGHERIKLVSAELLDSRTLRKHLKEVDAVIHLAARVTTPFANTDSHFYEQVNHWGTAELVYAVEELDNVKKLIYTSSTAVYGASEELATERADTDPSTFYGISKLRGEEHVVRLGTNKEAVILRCGNVYGYNKSMRFDAVINRFMFDANFGHRIQIFGNGKQSRAFIHVTHVAEIIKETLLKPVPSGIYNVVDKNLPILDIVDAMKEMFPELEYTFINQHISLMELKVSPETLLADYINMPHPESLRQELLEFKEKFSF
jgi:UDP-glucose 4-epimerase